MEYDDVLTNQPVVVDNGTGIIKAGFAGDNQPKCCLPSIVGRPKHPRAMAGTVEGDVFMGKKVEELRGLLKLNHAMEHGIVHDWDDMERLWAHMYSEELKALPEEHPVLLTEPPLNPLGNREQAAQIFFETYNVPAFYTSIQAVLSLYASGRTTGLVLDSGDGVSHAVPVYEGFTMPNAMKRIDVGGRDVTLYLQQLLRRAGQNFDTSAELEIVRQIKEKTCYISLDASREEKDLLSSGQLSLTATATVVPAASAAARDTFLLPDGRALRLGRERFKAPEILFRPESFGFECLGVHQLVANAIGRVDLDLRKPLYSNIVLSGGTSLTRGFGDRLLAELRRLAVRDAKIRIFAPPERKYSTWIGGSILASLSTFKKMWISSEEYQEDPDIIYKKCL